MDYDTARTPSFGRALSETARFGHVPRTGSQAARDCQDNQCAEEGLPVEDYGDENNPPVENNENLICGLDKRPLLPIGLAGSTFASACCVILLHMPLWAEMTGDSSRSTFFFLIVYTVVLTSMCYTALCDPGQLHPAPGFGGADAPLPRRARKAWLYTFPIRRYDHYCRWLCNVIGLLNHRSFIIMCGGLMLSVIISGLMDLPLMYHTAGKSAWRDCWTFFFHMCYCCAVLWFLGPIMWLHIGFVSRNELAHEWNKNFYNVAYSEKRGMVVHVEELSDDEYNDQFDFFEYDRSRNEWDRGAVNNCLTFWFTQRNGENELGEF